MRVFEYIAKPSRDAKQPRPLKSIGKVGRARQADRIAKLKAEPANHQGYRECYICHGWFKYVILEHVKDASTHPELRHVASNHLWACVPCNGAKKHPGV